MKPDSTLSRDEVAAILGLSLRHLDRIVSEGTLTCNRGVFDADEVHVLAQLRSRKLSLVDVAMMAQRAEISSRRTERVVRQLLDTFDFGQGLLSLEPSDVIALYLRVEAELEMYNPYNNAREIAGWACTFNMIGEEYFEVVAIHTGSDEPWRPYTSLAAKMLKEAPREEMRTDNALRLAFECLHKARKDMCIAGYNYVRKHHGKVLALRAFPDAKGDVHEDILNIAIKYTPVKN